MCLKILRSLSNELREKKKTPLCFFNKKKTIFIRIFWGGGLAGGTTYVHSVGLEQHANRKFKHHKTTSEVQRAKLVLLRVDILLWASAKQLCEEAMWEGPQEDARAPQESRYTMSSTCCLLQVGNSGKTQYKMETNGKSLICILS